MPLSLAVVGAGIGGLTAALALGRQGHAVTLIERRTGFTEVGAGLQLSPNASCVLIEFGLAPALRRVVGEPDRVVVRATRSGRTIGEARLGPFMRERFGAPYWVVHRADLQRILLDAVRSLPNVRLVMGRRVEAVEPETGRLTLVTERGSRDDLAVDAIVGADGIGSALRSAVDGAAAPAYRGYVAWRATLPRDRAPPALAANETGLWLCRSGHVVHYPIAGGRLLNLVAIERRRDPVEGWATPGDRADLLARFEGAAAPLRELLGAADSWLLWSLFDRPAGRLVRGRLALLGDAGHPILPFLAQGAALAIEDAAALSGALADEPDLPTAFAAYEQSRLARVARVQSEARRNGRIYHAPGPIAWARNLVMRRLGPTGMTERYAWLYGHAP